MLCRYAWEQRRSARNKSSLRGTKVVGRFVGGPPADGVGEEWRSTGRPPPRRRTAGGGVLRRASGGTGGTTGGPGCLRHRPCLETVRHDLPSDHLTGRATGGPSVPSAATDSRVGAVGDEPGSGRGCGRATGRPRPDRSDKGTRGSDDRGIARRPRRWARRHEGERHDERHRHEDQRRRPESTERSPPGGPRGDRGSGPDGFGWMTRTTCGFRSGGRPAGPAPLRAQKVGGDDGTRPVQISEECLGEGVEVVARNVRAPTEQGAHRRGCEKSPCEAVIPSPPWNPHAPRVGTSGGRLKRNPQGPAAVPRSRRTDGWAGIGEASTG